MRDGWQRTDADHDALMMAFSAPETRKIRQGAFTVGGRVYTGDELIRFEGQTVEVRLPKYTRWDGVPVYTMKGERIGVFFEAPERLYGDPAGAVEAGRLKKLARAAIREKAGQVRPTNVVQLAARSGERRKGTEKPSSAGMIGLHSDAALDGEAIRKGAALARAEQISETQRKHLEKIARLKAQGFYRVEPPL